MHVSSAAISLSCAYLAHFFSAHVEMAAHPCCRARTRTSGFRARTLTPGGRKVLKNRRKKGRHTLTPANNYKK
jgi:large subunit ribosomal protein L34